MRYLCPYHLAEILGVVTQDLTALSYQKLKKRVLAQFELRQNEAVQLKDQMINKSDFLAVIEELKNDEKSSFHRLVYENKLLLDFLEFGDPDFLTGSKPIGDDQFKLWVGPYFANRFSELLVKALKKRTIFSLFARPLTDHIDISYTDVAYKKGYSYLKNQVAEIAHMAEMVNEDYLKTWQKREADFDRQFWRSMNLLPDYFLELKDKLQDACATICNKTK